MSQHLDDLATLCDNRSLELHLFVTEKCNFRCLYCYEDFAIGKMRPAVATGVKNLLRARASELDLINLSFFGGEPLLAQSIILDLAREAQTLSAQYGFRVQGGMTTNGWYLDGPCLAKLVATGVSAFQITLDGPPPVHNRSRIRIDGRPTYERIVKNLLAARDTNLDFSIMLRIHLRPDTVVDVERWLPELRRLFLSDPRFTVLVKAVEHLGGGNDKDIQVFSTEEARAAIARAYNILGHSSAFRHSGIETRACYACRPNAWVIRADGTLARCTVALDDDRNRIGEIREDGTLAINAHKLVPWFNSLTTMDADALACPIAVL